MQTLHARMRNSGADGWTGTSGHAAECVRRVLSLQVDADVVVGDPIVLAAQCLPGGVRHEGLVVVGSGKGADSIHANELGNWR